MLRIIADSIYGREIVDRTFVRSEAEYLRNEYALAFGCDWTLTVQATRGQEFIDRIIELRQQGKTAGEICTATGLDRNAVNHYCALLAEHGIIAKRLPGMKEILVDRNDKIIELRRSGAKDFEIAAAMGMELLNVRSTLYRLRKQGRL